ncbi:branched-chain amino acid transport system ATP-binding protein [Thermomonospora echinospora]|uniref:Branched-chain amino acid transport system ATP-binding protein n=1 Tax=Thermomonospora echinospora TaxID=1992 RepID=A0A1H6EA59_9ACTN|nr:ABC transporter ATP-binding protein [Thermomonospora echinospora]SEG93695.1 branched-chain amino acid transport system ATP-binding protein [Thermomonospora echinospora]
MTAPLSPEPVLRVRNLATGYGDLRVVWDVSLDVRPGELTVLLGRNGAGKTSTLRAVAGLNKASAGSVELAGADVTRTPAHRRVRQGLAYVQEGKRVFHRQTVEQNLVVGGYTRGMSRSALRAEAEGIYEIFPVLGDKRNVLAGDMSGGQQQMLAIGQALMAAPKVLLLDEPSGGLAPVIVGQVMEQVARLREHGIGVLLVEQALEASIRVADHIVVLDMGRVLVSVRKDDLDDIATLREAYFGRRAGHEPLRSSPDDR